MLLRLPAARFQIHSLLQWISPVLLVVHFHTAGSMDRVRERDLQADNKS